MFVLPTSAEAAREGGAESVASMLLAAVPQPTTLPVQRRAAHELRRLGTLRALAEAVAEPTTAAETPTLVQVCVLSKGNFTFFKVL